jgi:DNA-binding NtrC family response regulator
MGAARLLIVDDETSLLALLQRYLERLGYKVETVSTAAGALALFESDPAGYALVVTDLTLPGISGEELTERLHAHNPRLPVIISSGYPYQPRSKNVRFLQKPYLPQMLAEAIAEMLRGAKSARV